MLFLTSTNAISIFENRTVGRLAILAAKDKDEATKIALNHLLAEFSSKNGYSNHSVFVTAVEKNDVLKTIVFDDKMERAWQAKGNGDINAS